MSDFLSTLQPFEYQKKWYSTQIEEGKKELQRVDGRKLLEGRKIDISPNTFSTSQGSSSLTLRSKVNSTICHTGIKVEFSPSHGNDSPIKFIYNLTLAAGSSPSIRPGPPLESAQSISKLMGTELLPMILKMNILIPNLSSFSIPDGLDIILYIDTIVTSHNGNIFSSAWNSVFIALLDCRFSNSISLTEESFLFAPNSDNHNLGTNLFICEASQYLLPFKLMKIEILNQNLFLNDCSLVEEESFSGNSDYILLLIEKKRNKIIFARGSLSLLSLPPSILMDITAQIE